MCFCRFDSPYWTVFVSADASSMWSNSYTIHLYIYLSDLLWVILYRINIVVVLAKSLLYIVCAFVYKTWLPVLIPSLWDDRLQREWSFNYEVVCVSLVRTLVKWFCCILCVFVVGLKLILNESCLNSFPWIDFMFMSHCSWICFGKYITFIVYTYAWKTNRFVNSSFLNIAFFFYILMLGYEREFVLNIFQKILSGKFYF